MQPADDRPAPTVPSGLVLAPFGRRILGALLDQLLVLVPVAIGVVLAGYRPGDDLSDDELLLMNAITVGVAFVYETVMVGVFGRTVGKIAAGTRVVSASQSGMVRAYAFWMVLGISLAGIIIALVVAGAS